MTDAIRQVLWRQALLYRLQVRIADLHGLPGDSQRRLLIYRDVVRVAYRALFAAGYSPEDAVAAWRDVIRGAQ
jgi:hypothetical protein